MTEKTLPLGICDNCGESFPPQLSLYTKHGPRRYCSIECRNTGNSRAGAPIRAARQRERVASGEWQSPYTYMTAEEISAAHAKAARTGRLREVAAGRWRNPALSPAAREKLSRPRKHGDNPALHSAIEKMHGGRMSDLTPEEQVAYRQYQKSRRQTHREEINAWQRNYYCRCMADPERRARLREKWQRQNKRRQQTPPG